MLRAADIIWKTDTGRQRRDNEDNAFVRAPLFVVADGMGGAQAGEVASAIAVEEFEHELPREGTPEDRLSGRIRDANRRIYERARSEDELDGMGTTLTAVLLEEGDLAVAHVGDSRAYIFRGGELARLTQDHSLVEELVRQGKLTEAQAAEHPQRSIITRALGIEADVEVDTWAYPARAGDIVLLCSDGLTSMIEEDRVAEILSRQPDLGRAGDLLIRAANDAGGRDNITVILFRLEEGGKRGEPALEQDTIVGLERAAAGRSPSAGGGSRSSGQHGGGGAGGATMVVPPPSVEPRRPAAPRPSRTQGRPPAPPPRRRSERFIKTASALIAVVVVLFLVGGGGYLASREYFFLGTNSDGMVTVYRGFPYDLPLGIHLYEQVYVSGVPLDAVPSDRRPQLLNHQLRSQGSAISLVHAAELGQLSR